MEIHSKQTKTLFIIFYNGRGRVQGGQDIQKKKTYE